MSREASQASPLCHEEAGGLFVLRQPILDRKWSGNEPDSGDAVQFEKQH
jgi:hypothetical protein